jgi:hypothetical protein
MYTINNFRSLFNNIATAHKQINSFGFGELWEVEEYMNKDVTYPLLWVQPVNSTTGLQVQTRTFRFLVIDLVSKQEEDNDYTTEVWSDTELILNDIIKILRMESDSYNVVGEPLLEPFKEEFSDWTSGWRSDIVIETDLNSNYCDVPASTFVSPETTTGTTVQIIDQDGNVLATINQGGNYVVTVLTTLNDTITANVTTVLDDII